MDDCARQVRADSAVSLDSEFPEGMHKGLKVMEKSVFFFFFLEVSLLQNLYESKC